METLMLWAVSIIYCLLFATFYQYSWVLWKTQKNLLIVQKWRKVGCMAKPVNHFHFPPPKTGMIHHIFMSKSERGKKAKLIRRHTIFHDDIRSFHDDVMDTKQDLTNPLVLKPDIGG